MLVSKKTIAKLLEQGGFVANHKNTLAVSDYLERDYEREEWASILDAVNDCIEELNSANRLASH